MSDAESNAVPEENLEEAQDAVSTEDIIEDVDDIAEDVEEADDEQRIATEVEVKEVGACERHVVVTVPRDDINRYLDDAYSELMPKAQVAGFRQGRAPRKLVETRFKDEVTNQVKGSLLMDAMGQVTDEQDFSAISEPDFDYEAIQMPDDGPLTFEFSVEVRPDFDMPEWKGLTLEQQSHEYTQEEVEAKTKDLLQRYGEVEDHDGPVTEDDVVIVNVTFKDGDEEVSSLSETSVPVRETLSFADGELAEFDKLVLGQSKGDTASGKATLSETLDTDNAGKSYDAEVEIIGIKRVNLPELTEEFLENVGGFKSEEDLHEVVKGELERQLQYHQQQGLRQQITGALTESASWELPPALLRRQSQRELQRAILEMQSSGFPEEEIRRQINRIQQNLLGSTERALREHFILERIAEENELEATSEDVEREILIIAMQQETSPRRVRARLEKQGDMDALRNQIVERKSIELITSEAEIKEVPLEDDSSDNSFPVSHASSGQVPGSEVVEKEAAVEEPAEETATVEAESETTEEASDEATSEEASADEAAEAASDDSENEGTEDAGEEVAEAAAEEDASEDEAAEEEAAEADSDDEATDD
ncbi:MAG: trigger factor [Pirellulales bacterium]|nr:trigger factor [Pirellulales bacterium]